MFGLTGNDKFNVRCELRDFQEEEDLKHVPPISKFPVYMYDTGPKRLIDNFLKIDPDSVDVRDNINYVSCPQNILLPLPGGSNPLWYSDWHPQNCHQSALLDVFSNHLRDFFHIPDFHEDNSQLKLTIVDRKATCKLRNLNAYMTKLRIAYPKVTINAVDLAAYSFADQLEVVRNTDILVGAHGAGLIHSLFLPPHSAVVEIFPADVSYPVYRNLAKLRGHQYYSDHALVAAAGQDWPSLDIEIDEYAFVALVDVAVKSMKIVGR